jgi:hypothetical protein
VTAPFAAGSFDGLNLGPVLSAIYYFLTFWVIYLCAIVTYGGFSVMSLFDSVMSEVSSYVILKAAAIVAVLHWLRLSWIGGAVC